MKKMRVEQCGVFFLPEPAGSVDLALLLGVAAKLTKRLARISEIAVAEEMAPHFQVDDLTIAGVETALAVLRSKEHGGRFADEIFGVQQTAPGECISRLKTVGADVIPLGEDVGVAVD